MKKLYADIDFATSNNFKIDVLGKLDKSLSDNLGGLFISHKTENDITISFLEGKIIDQAELIGILNTLYNMRFPIINVSMHTTTKK